MKDYSFEAVQYFDSMRSPAALIAGSALAGLFVFTDLSTPGHETRRGRLENLSLVLYHVLSLLSILWNINVIVTATAVANSFRLDRSDIMATSTFSFLNKECAFELLFVSWSFYMGLFSFLAAIALRSVLAFKLLVKERRRSALVILLSVSALFFHLVSVVNEKMGHTNLAVATWKLVKMGAERTVKGQKPAEWAAIACTVGALVSMISLTQTAADVSNDNPTKKKIPRE